MDQFNCKRRTSNNNHIFGHEEGYIRKTQPVMIQSFDDEFELPNKGEVLPAREGDILKREDGNPLEDESGTNYRKGTAKLMHMMRWSRNDVLNRTRELSRFMSAPTTVHRNAMYKVMNYVKSTKHLGNIIKPNAKWDGNQSFEFIIRGKSDSEYATDPETRRSVSGVTVFLFDAVIKASSRMQKCITLSVTEAEFVAIVECIQDMMFAMRVIESMGLKVKLPMIVESDNKGAIDLINNWSTAGRTRHIATRVNFIRELKAQGIIEPRWISNEFMSSDIFTKNVGGEPFRKHRSVFVG